MKLNSSLSFFCYLMLQNRHSWGLLDDDAQSAVLKDNFSFNNERDDYADPELYGKGRFAEGADNWDSKIDRKFRHRGKFLARVLEKYKPQRILEIGPGSGFDSRSLCEAESTKFYMAVDVVAPFLEHLRPRLAALSAQKTGFTYELVCEDFKKLQGTQNFDAVFILSAIHHIPDRVELFTKLSEFLRPGGIVVCYEPTHYLRRILQLSRDFFVKGYFKKSHFSKKGNISTHHFCTYAEFETICRKTKSFEIVYKEHDTPKKLKAMQLEGTFWDQFWMSREIGVVLRKL